MRVAAPDVEELGDVPDVRFPSEFPEEQDAIHRCLKPVGGRITLTQNRWSRLLRKILAFVTFTVTYVFAVVGSQAFVYSVFSGASFYVTVEVVALITTNALMFVTFFYYRQTTGDLWISEEAERFLRIRSRQTSKSTSRWRKRIRRSALWAPTALVLLAFLFLPESLGMLSHLFWNRTINGRNLEVPLTWIIADDATTFEDGHNIGRSIWIVAAKGIGRVGAGKYWRKEVPVSEMSFASYPTSLYEPRPSPYSKVVARRELHLGNEVLICWDIVPFAETRPEPMNPQLAEIVCDGMRNDFHVSFSGSRADLGTFNDMLQRRSAGN